MRKATVSRTAATVGVVVPAVAVVLISPAEAALELGVSEADVLATLEAGELKGKKIGASWRITRGAMDDFLKS
ncbi:MAG: helix-turn-helix domain-containing protein [Verrucomicrobiota bacterium]